MLGEENQVGKGKEIEGEGKGKTRQGKRRKREVKIKLKNGRVGKAIKLTQLNELLVKTDEDEFFIHFVLDLG